MCHVLQFSALTVMRSLVPPTFVQCAKKGIIYLMDTAFPAQEPAKSAQVMMFAKLAHLGPI